MPRCMNPPCPPPSCMCSMLCGASAGLSCAKTVAAASRLISKNFIVHIGTPLAWLVPNGMSPSYLHPVSSSCGLETGLLQEECSSSCSPHSPKLNAHVERSHRTHSEKFY